MTQDKMQEMEKISIEFQKSLIDLVEKCSAKLPPIVVLMAIASIIGKMISSPYDFGVKKNRLKTLVKKQIGL